MNLLPIGTMIRAVQRGNARDYNGIPPFETGGRFSPNEKGIYDDQWAGESTLIADDNGQKLWSPALPNATHYFIVEPTQPPPRWQARQWVCQSHAGHQRTTLCPAL